MMTEDLQEIVGRAYELFAAYGVAKPLDVCPCCLKAKEMDQLVSLDVKHIPQKLLYTWNHAAKTDHPDLIEFKPFLPRFLDLIAQCDFPSHSVEITLKSFRYYTDGEWTREERRLIDDFGWAFFQHCLRTFPLPNVISLDEIIIMLSLAGVDIAPLLFEWEISEHKESVFHFAEFAIYGVDLGNPFAEAELNAKLLAWLGTEGVVSDFSDKIKDLILNQDEAEEDVLPDLSWAYKRLQLFG